MVVQKEKLELAGKVFFDTGKSSVRADSTELLDEVAAAMAAHPEVEHVVIEGHTDTSGSAARNRRLSQERADAVRSYLVLKGVAPERLQAKGYGGAKPVGDNKTAEGREQNRRVEFTISAVGRPSPPFLPSPVRERGDPPPLPRRLRGFFLMSASSSRRLDKRHDIRHTP